MNHPLERYVTKEKDAAKLAKAANCSIPHLRNICAGRKNASLPLAKRLSDITGIRMDAFMIDGRKGKPAA